jgi:Flp pilus assembly protein TadD
LDTVKNDNKELRDLRITLLQNTAVICNKTGDFKESIRCCTKALTLDEKAAKAWYLRSVAHMKSHNFDEATKDCKTAIILNA